MNKAFENFTWLNEPSSETPLNAQNLMKINNGLNEVDNRVINLDKDKFDKNDARKLIKKIEFDPSAGVFTITYFDNSKDTFNTIPGSLVAQKRELTQAEYDALSTDEKNNNTIYFIKDAN